MAGCGGADGGPPDDGVEIIRGAEGAAWIDVTLAGEGLDVPAGTTVIMEIGIPDRAPERLGHAVTHVEAGAFSVAFPSVWESGLYKQKLVLLDLDDDGQCDDGEPLLADYSASEQARTLTARPPGEGGFLWGDFAAGECADFVADWPTQ